MTTSVSVLDRAPPKRTTQWDDKNMHDIFGDAYKLRYKYQGAITDKGGTEDFWKAVLADATHLVNKYDRHPFAISLAVACYWDIEREYKERNRTQ